ncbi:hypothetical protein Tco_0338211, partial [Tanacetum coccineum]
MARKTSLKKKRVQKGSVSKHGRKSVKSFKGEPSVHKDPNFKDLDDFVDVDDTLDYMETEDDQDKGRTSYVVLEEKESAELKLLNEGTADQNEGKSATQTALTTLTHTPTIFGDDETIAQVLITMSQNKKKEKEKGVEIRNVE